MFLRRALTRTSVGNKKYEYEYENRNLTRVHERGTQRERALGDRVAGGVALRHDPTLSEGFGVCQQEFSKNRTKRRFFWIGRLDGWTAERP